MSERKFVTVVFFDMVGSLSTILDKDPEEAHEVLGSALGVMTEAVHAYGGVVAERQGDGIMAIFGAPRAFEDHATRACLAALRLHALVAQTLVGRIKVRAGINSGEVAVGPSLNDFSSDYTATGAVVHIAARLQSGAPPNATVMTAQTAALVRDSMLTEPIGHLPIKGLPAPMEIHRLVGPIGSAQRMPARKSGLFVGRVASLALLDEALAVALEGRGCLYAIVGEAGIGKSTLVEHFSDRHGPDVVVVKSTAPHYDNVAPFRPFAEIVQQLLGLAGVARGDRRSSLVDWLVELSLDPAIYEAPLSDLLDLQGVPESWWGLAPLLRHGRIGSAVADALFAEARRRQLVIVVEDLQRADSATLELIQQLARSIRDHRLLLIVAFRPELAQRWILDESCRQLRLDRLTDEDTRKLIAAFLGVPAPPRTEEHLIRWSKGNPLFVRESVRVLREVDAIGDPEAASRIAVPQSIGAIIASRIDRLGRDTKHALLAASVIGKQFSFHVLAAVSGSAEEILSAHMDALVAEEFIRRVEQVAERCYVFEHGLFQEVGYAMLLLVQRKELHREAFHALLRYAQNASPAVEELAHHAYCGGLWTEAAPLCREAGRRAAARYSNREAATHLENAIAALAQADPKGERLGDAISLRLELRAVSIPLLRLSRIGILLTEAKDLAGRLGDLSESVRITSFQAGHAYLTRDPTRCIQLCRRALRLAAPASDMRLRIAPVLYMAQANYGLGRYRRVVEILSQDLATQTSGLSGAAAGLPLRPLLMRAYWLAIALAELGRFRVAEGLADEMLSLADDRQPFESLYALTAQGFILMLHGELEGALRSSTEALAAAERHDIAFIIPVLASQVGLLLARRGRVAEGLALARRAIRKADEIGSIAGESRWRARYGEICLRAGEVSEARRHADTAVRLAEEGNERGYLCSALRLRAKTKVAQVDLGGASVDLQRAISVASRAKVGPALAKCRFDAGVLASILGKLDEACSGLSAARAAFLRYNMSHDAAYTADVLAGLRDGFRLPAFGTLFGNAE